MVISTSEDYDRLAELKAFDDSKTGVKGLVDAGVTRIPRIFIHSPEILHDYPIADGTHFQIPVIDLEGVEKDAIRRQEIVNQVLHASSKWGFFQVVNHGIPQSVLDEMIAGVRRFHEQDTEVKKQYYSRDPKRKVEFNSNFDLYRSPAANWRDTLFCGMIPDPPSPEELPVTCRDILIDYSKHLSRLGINLYELISEALGLDPNYLKNMGCNEGHLILSHYYPACPEPELTLGTASHPDVGFITVLLQDQIGGLQVLHENLWVDVPPVPGALVVNVADLLQLISNDRLKSVEHRVVANRSGPRVSVVSFFTTHIQASNKLYGPIKELLSEDNRPVYREITQMDYAAYRLQKGFDYKSALDHFKL